MDEVCLIPEHVLNDLSTNALFVTCLFYPRLIDMFLASNMQVGFDFISTHFNGLEELVTRTDLAQVLLIYYQNLDLQKAMIKGYDFTLKSFQIAFLEILISQTNIISQLKFEEKNMLLKEANMKLWLRKTTGASLYQQKTSAFVIARVLASIDKSIFEIDINGNDIFEIFNSYAILSDSTIVDKLFEASKEE